MAFFPIIQGKTEPLPSACRVLYLVHIYLHDPTVFSPSVLLQCCTVLLHLLDICIVFTSSEAEPVQTCSQRLITSSAVNEASLLQSTNTQGPHITLRQRLPVRAITP